MSDLRAVSGTPAEADQTAARPVSAAGIAQRQIVHDGIRTAYLEAGHGRPLLLIHGSGPGVSALANWRGTMTSHLAERRRILAPDVVGFGDTHAEADVDFTHDLRAGHLIGFLDAMRLAEVDVVGNSMGGALALSIAHRRPELIRRMVLMGSVGISFPITSALDQIWGYQPSLQNMEAVIRLFAYDQGLINPDLVRLRHQASIAPGVQERYAAAFAAPRQRHLDAMALSEPELRTIETPTLLVHGANDQVIPAEQTSLRLVRLLPAADLVVFSRCGHWTQIERAFDFTRHVADFTGS
ncbi:MAG: alpha/beta fold hydrolase [Micromonosporaceae bacterium]